jgi:hypothetical protein
MDSGKPDQLIKEESMAEAEKEKTPKKYVYVKDAEGIEYVCRLEDLKRADQLTEDEKEKCMSPPGDA